MKKGSVFCVFLFIGFLGQSLAQEVDEVVFTTKTKSMYLGVDGSIFYYNHVVQQSDIFVAWKNGVFFDLWTSSSFDQKRDFGKEVDFTIGKTGRVGKFNYSVDLNYFAIVITDVTVANLQIDRSFQIKDRLKLSPFVRVEGYHAVHRGGPRSGMMGLVGLDSSTKLSSRMTLNTETKLRKDSGCFAFDSVLLGQGYIELSAKLSSRVSMTTRTTLSTPLSHVRDGRHPTVAYELGLSYKIK